MTKKALPLLKGNSRGLVGKTFKKGQLKRSLTASDVLVARYNCPEKHYPT